MNKSNISEKFIQELEDILIDDKAIAGWKNRLKEEEPLYSRWVYEICCRVMDRIMKITPDLKFEVSQEIAFHMHMGFLSGWIAYMKLMNNCGEEERLKISQFEKWLKGEMPASFYDYSIEGLDKASSRYTAKKAYSNRVKEKIRRTKRSSSKENDE